MITKIYMVAFLILYFLIVFIIPSVLVKYRAGINPYVFKYWICTQLLVQSVSTYYSLFFIVELVNLFYPEGRQFFTSYLGSKYLIMKYIGFIFIHLALSWIVIAQIQISNSWWVGIDHSAKKNIKRMVCFLYPEIQCI